MRILRLTCKSCGAPFESGVPLAPEHVRGVKLRALEVCPVCGAEGDYDVEDYRDTDRNGGAATVEPADPGDSLPPPPGTP